MISDEFLSRAGIKSDQLDSLIVSFATTAGAYRNTKNFLKLIGPEDRE